MKIDTTKPMQLADGTQVKLVNAEAIPTEPQLRDRYTAAHNPFTGQ